MTNLPGQQRALRAAAPKTHVTAELAHRWHFPDTIVRALETADDPMAAAPFCRIGGILHVATPLAEIGLEDPMSPTDTIASLPVDVIQALQLDAGWLVAAPATRGRLRGRADPLMCPLS
ncbi:MULTISPECIES: hypothetical protein [unclassified Acidovorax]|uniref:hypothetical protein n=1 Tax=unclassified Acidovorax TaxID=2684926 RepID=UPI002882FFF7|nr:MULTISPECIES: hypothetical protein [unclassified Acidovorax]